MYLAKVYVNFRLQLCVCLFIDYVRFLFGYGITAEGLQINTFIFVVVGISLRFNLSAD